MINTRVTLDLPGETDSSTCKTCHGNDKNIPCAYPSGGKAGCLRDSRLLPNGRLSEKLPAGTRIEFIKNLSEGATGDHPALEYARKGELGKVIDHRCVEGHWVKPDNGNPPFGAVLNEEFNSLSSGLTNSSLGV